jgi:hypothetical protein
MHNQFMAAAGTEARPTALFLRAYGHGGRGRPPYGPFHE